MSGKRGLQSLQAGQVDHAAPFDASQSGRELRCYTVPDLLRKLSMAQSTFTVLKRHGKLPFLTEIRPRVGRRARYRADLVDRYLSGQWDQSRFFRRGA